MNGWIRITSLTQTENDPNSNCVLALRIFSKLPTRIHPLQVAVIKKGVA